MFKRLIGTKTFWTGLASVAGGVVAIVKGDVNGGIAAIVIGVQSIMLRDALAKK